MSSLSPQQQSIAGVLGKQIKGGLQSGGTPQYPGQQVAPLDPLYGNLYGNLQQSMDQAGQNDVSTNQAIQDLLTGKNANSLNSQNTTDYYNKGVLNPLMNTYNTQIKPKIDQAFAASGRSFSAARGFANQRALTDIGVQSQATLAQGIFQNQQLAAQLSQSGQQSGVQLSQAQALQPFNRITAAQGALVPYQNFAQNQATAAYQQWQQSQAYNSPWIGAAQQFLGNAQVSMYNPQTALQQYSPYIGAAAGLLSGGIIGGQNSNIGSVAGSLIGGGAGLINSQR